MPAKYSIQLQSIDHPLVGSSSCNCQAISRIVREKIVLSLQWCLNCQIQRHRLYDYRIIAVNGAGTSTSEPTELSKCIYVTEIYKWLLFNTFCQYYSETFVKWSPLGCSKLAAIQRWPDYTAYFQQGSPLWDIIRWLF